MTIDPKYKNAFVRSVIKSLSDSITNEEVKLLLIDLIENRLSDDDIEYIADRIDGFYYSKVYKEETQ